MASSSGFSSGGNGSNTFRGSTSFHGDESAWALYSEVCDLMYELQQTCTHFGYRFNSPAVSTSGTWVAQFSRPDGTRVYSVAFSVRIHFFYL